MNQIGLSHNRSTVHLMNPKCIIHFSSDKNSLQHYGVPGQKWGVITKEYEPVAIDHRRMKSSQQHSVRRANGPRTREDYRREAQVIRERNERVRRKVLIGGAVALGLIAAYGAYRYRHIVKAKAYSGLLDRFMSQNPGANFRTESGRQLMRKGVQYAEANSKKFRTAKATNAYLKRRGLMSNTKEARRVYKARRLIKKCASYNGSTNKFKQAVYKSRNRRLVKRMLQKYIV